MTGFVAPDLRKRAASPSEAGPLGPFTGLFPRESFLERNIGKGPKGPKSERERATDRGECSDSHRHVAPPREGLRPDLDKGRRIVFPPSFPPARRTLIVGLEARALVLMELVPSEAYGQNLRTMLDSYQWAECKWWSRAVTRNKCMICGGKGRKYTTETHERWSYEVNEDEGTGIQRLTGLVALCPRCHAVKHFGRAEHKGHGDPIKAHAMRVNGWTSEQFEQHRQEEYQRWSRRKNIKWTVDIGWVYENVLTESTH